MTKSKTLKWFTPAPDVLVERYAPNGLIPAMVWGKVYRYSKMKDEVCKASIIRMSMELRITPKTFSKYLKKLVEDGFIQDLTPNVTFSRHIYICTDKVHEATENWLIEKELKEAKYPWVDIENIEVIPASKEVIPEGNGSLPNRDHVPPNQGPGTDKYSTNKASNNVVEETFLKAKELPGDESRFNSPAVSAVNAGGETDGISRQKSLLEKHQDKLVIPETKLQKTFLEVYELERFGSPRDKRIFERYESLYGISQPVPKFERKRWSDGRSYETWIDHLRRMN